MELNHLLVPCRDKIASAEYFSRVMGLPRGEVGHFAPVKINDSTVLDFAEIDDVSLWEKENSHFARQHYAFKVSEADAQVAAPQERSAEPNQSLLHRLRVDRGRVPGLSRRTGRPSRRGRAADDLAAARRIGEKRRTRALAAPPAPACG